MNLIDRYIFNQILRPLAIALLIALIVFLISRVMQLMDLVLGTEGPLKVILELMGYLLPRYLSMALPISLLFGVMIAFSKMSQDGETDALQSAGFGLARQLRSALLIALAVAILATSMHSYLRPYARYAYESMVHAVTEAAIHASVRAGVFAKFGDVTFLVQNIGSDGISFHKVFLYEDEGHGDVSAVAASNGGLVRSQDSGRPILRLFDGIRLTIEPIVAVDGQETSRATVLRFRELRSILGDQQALMFRPRGVDEREMTMVELWQRRDNPPQGVRSSDLIAELHGRVVRILSIPFLPLIGVCLAKGRRRSDRYFGFGLALAIIVAYEQVLDFGENSVEAGVVSALTGLWLPFFAYVALTLGFFARMAYFVPNTPFSMFNSKFSILIRVFNRPEPQRRGAS
ncbi:MAG: LptF/LptG family permease [Hyphomicrobiales bacterium]|nr:LptF/LptG family permease [Hyphomicrobiales bacterium]